MCCVYHRCFARSTHSSLQATRPPTKMSASCCDRCACVFVLTALCASIQPSMFAASTLTLPHVTHNHGGTTVPALCAWWGAPDLLGCVPAGRSVGTPACCAPGRFLRSSVTTTHDVHDATAAATGALTWLPLCVAPSLHQIGSLGGGLHTLHWEAWCHGKG